MALEARKRAPAQVLLAAGAALTLVGCNALLGIDAPKERPLGSDDEVPYDPQYEDDGGTGSTQLTNDESPPEPVTPSGPPPPYAWARWPMPNPVSLADAKNPQTFVTEAPDLVMDAVTKLGWQRSVDKESRARADAESYCADLQLAGGGFRLPSRIELLSLVDFTQANPCLDPKAFPDAPRGKFWTSSDQAGSRANGWLVNFEFSTTLVVSEPVTKEYLVRCVRSDENVTGAAVAHFVVKGETVEDSATHLTWQRALSSKAFSNADAVRYCAALSLNGGGYRLPTIKELHTLVDETASQPASDREAFPDTPTQAFWSSSPLTNFVQYVWSVNFSDGSDSWFPSESLLRARCVR